MLVCFKVIRKKIKREGLWEEIINPISAMFCHYSLCLGEEVSLPLTTPLCPPDSSSSSFHLIIGYILSSAFSGSVPPLSLISDIPLGELLLFLTSQLLTPLELKVHFLLSHFPLVRKVFLKKNLFFFPSYLLQYIWQLFLTKFLPYLNLEVPWELSCSRHKCRHMIYTNLWSRT